MSFDTNVFTIFSAKKENKNRNDDFGIIKDHKLYLQSNIVF